MRTQCIEDLQCFETFPNYRLFFSFWLFRNYYSGDAHHVNYGRHSSNHHFRHGADSVYKICSVLKLFEIAVCSARFGLFEITTSVMRIMLTMAKIVQIIISNMAHTVYIRFTVFSNFSNLQIVLHVLTFSKLLYSGDAHHVNYGKHSLHRHFRHCAHSVFRIYSVLKLFEFAVCSARFGLFEITTSVMGIMLTMANIV